MQLTKDAKLTLNLNMQALRVQFEQDIQVKEKYSQEKLPPSSLGNLNCNLCLMSTLPESTLYRNSHRGGKLS